MTDLNFFCILLLCFHLDYGTFSVLKNEYNFITSDILLP